MGVPKIVNVLLSIVVVVVVVVSSAKGEGESRFQHFFSHFFFFWLFLNSLLNEAALAGKSDFGKKNKLQPAIYFVSVISTNRLVVDNDSIRYPGRMLGLMGPHHLLGDLDLVGLGKTRGFFIWAKTNLLSSGMSAATYMPPNEA